MAGPLVVLRCYRLLVGGLEFRHRWGGAIVLRNSWRLCFTLRSAPAPKAMSQ